jgi:hypothetical protein
MERVGDHGAVRDAQRREYTSIDLGEQDGLCRSRRAVQRGETDELVLLGPES